MVMENREFRGFWKNRKKLHGKYLQEQMRFKRDTLQFQITNTCRSYDEKINFEGRKIEF